jgi:hypothetical protein
VTDEVVNELEINSLCPKLMRRLDDETRGELRVVCFQLAANLENVPGAEAAKSYLAGMFDLLEPANPR